MGGQVHLTAAVPATATPAMRWQGPRGSTRPSAAALGAAMLLHLAVGLFALTLVRLPTPPPASDERAVAMVFAPAPASHLAVPDVPVQAPVVPGALPEPPAPPEAPMVAAPPSPTPAPSAPFEAPPPSVLPPPPAVPQPTPEVSLPPAVNALPPRPVRQPPPRPKIATPSHTTTVPASGTPPSQPRPSSEPTRQVVPTEAPPSVPSNARRDSAVSTPAPPPAPIAVDWQRSVFGWLAAHKTYPEVARRRGEEGRVGLRFTVDRSGRVLDVMVVSSSASPRLDNAALAMLRNASLPPFPATMPQERVTATVQIRYRLTD